MATLALVAEVTEMRVIVLVTGDAILGKAHYIRGLAVTTGTRKLFVCTGQSEAGLLAMIKLPDAPTVR